MPSGPERSLHRSFAGITKLRLSDARSPRRLVSAARAFARRFRRIPGNGLRRQLACLVLILNLLAWVGGASSVGHRKTDASELATKVQVATRPVSGISSLISSFQDWLTSSTTPVDRNASVSSIRISPVKMVGHQGQHVSFTAIGLDSSGATAHGATFSWTANSANLQVDGDGGQALLLNPGLVWVTATCGGASARVPVLIKSGPQRLQSDVECRAEQSELNEDGSGSGVGALIDRLTESLAPTAHAQSGGGDSADFLYDELYTQPRNLVGSPRNVAVEPTRIGPVLPEGSNFELAVPFSLPPSRGLSAGAVLGYNSRGVWGRHGSAITFNPVNTWPYLGFSISFGRIVTYGSDPNTKFLFIDSDGTRRYLGTGLAGGSNTLQTSDGSHLVYVGNAFNGTLYYSNGASRTFTTVNNRLLCVQVNDCNGNYLTISYVSQPSASCSSGGNSYGYAWNQAISAVKDTEGRIMAFQYDSCNLLTAITVPGFNNTSQGAVLAQFDYVTANISTSFSGLTLENVPAAGNSVVELSHIYFPATQTGYYFSYSTYGVIYNVSHQRQMSINGSVIGNGVESTHVSFNYPTTDSSLNDAPAFTQRTESPGVTGGSDAVYTYSTSTGTNSNIFTVTRPDSSTLTLTRSTDATSPANGLLIQSEIKSSGGASFSKTVTSYANDPGGSPQVQTVTTYDDTGTPTQVNFDYDQYGNLANKREFGYQVGSQWQGQRRTHYTYVTDPNYINAYMRGLVSEVDVYDQHLSNNNDAAGVLIAKSTVTYDNYSSMGGMVDPGSTPKPPNWNSLYSTSYTLRGNPTGTTQWTDVVANTSITRLNQYNKFGNVVAQQVSCCKQKSFSYTSVDYWSSPQQITSGDPVGVHLTATYKYDFNTGLPLYYQVPNGAKYNFSYDAALRLQQEQRPGEGYETFTYNDASMTAMDARDGFGALTKTVDGWGRVVQGVGPNNGQVNVTYDAMGRVATQTNPFPAGGNPGPPSRFTYDALGRTIAVTQPDNQQLQTVYSGNTVAAVDQVGRQIKRQVDGLGRLIQVTEQDSTGALTQATTYSYDFLDDLIGVNQGNQTRSFKYDAAKRLLYERIPEQSATINDGAGTMWSTGYTYTDFNAVATKTDARGVAITYSYDTMNRLFDVLYQTGNAPGVAATPEVTLSYNTSQLSSSNGMLLSASAGSVVDNFTYDSLNRVSSISRSIDSQTYTIGYLYNPYGQRSQITYPSTRVMNMNPDGVGRPGSVTDANGTNYISGMTYDAAGHLTADTLGNGVVEGYGYDANRMQLVSQTAGTAAPYTNLMNLSYNYQAAAGQSGTGTTAGNSGQLMGVTGTINGAAESATYSYDLQARLTTSSQTSNGVSAQRRFAYDRWGNRTGEWDATSGGNQIQTVTLQQSGGAPTNQIQSVSGNGAGVYAYDAAGNVTSDGTHTYTYDAQNRIVAVDGGSTAQYTYDYASRRIKKVALGTTTHYIWDGNQLLAEHDGATGAVLVDYVNAQNGFVAKINSGNVYYFLRDRLSERLRLDSSGNVLGQLGTLPYGEDFAESGQQEKHHFTTYERDATGDDYAINRFYSSLPGRFRSPDWFGKSARAGSPQTWNRYAYAQGDPLNKTDPLGLDTIVCFAVPVQGVEGGVVDCLDDGNPRRTPQPEIAPDPAGGGRSLMDQLNSVLNRGDCRKKLKNVHLGGTNGAPDDVASFLKSAAMISSLNDLTTRSDLTSITARDLDWQRWGHSYDIALSAWFAGSDPNRITVGPDGATVDAYTNVKTHEVFIGHNYNIADTDRKDTIITHELLHNVFPGDGHDDIATKLGVPGSPFNNDQAASDAIDKWLKKGCPDKLPSGGGND
jgi:RHS repeat-associated protein